MSYHKSNKYIDLKINGRLFPTWLLANFKKYKLPKPIQDENEKQMKIGLKKYQEFIGKYMDYNSPYHNILLYHGIGSGKTATTINIYNILYNYSPNWNVFILLKATLQTQTWFHELKKWLEQDNYDSRYKNIIFIHTENNSTLM